MKHLSSERTNSRLRSERQRLPGDQHPSFGRSKNESSLHRELKSYLAQPDDLIEHRIDGYIIDIVRGDSLLEIQTANFGIIQKKIKKLAVNHAIKIVYPVFATKWITRIDCEGKVIGRRKSPKRGSVLDIFDELVHVPHLFRDPKVSLLVLFLEIEEVRALDGKGSWRRGGSSIVDRLLISVTGDRSFQDGKDFVELLPGSLKSPFSSDQVAISMQISKSKAGKVLYALRHMGLIEVVGKRRNNLLYDYCPR